MTTKPRNQRTITLAHPGGPRRVIIERPTECSGPSCRSKKDAKKSG